MFSLKAFFRRYPVAAYFGIAFLLSYGGGLVLEGPKLLRGEAIQPLDALLLFPVIVIGVGLTGIALTSIVDGRRGLRDLFSRITRWRVGIQWYAVVLLPPALFLALHFVLSMLISPSFASGFFPLGIAFGLVAGFFEEIGWMGYVFPKMQGKWGTLSASLLLGVLWGLWHAPVVDYLGAAVPHGVYWLPFFLSFIAMVAALRVLIVWIYANTGSVLLAMLLHASNTGFLALLGPSHISAAQETLSYAIYAAILWGIVALVVAVNGKSLVRQSPMAVKAV